MTVKVEIDDRLATVTINRPEVRNALSRQVLADLRAALPRLRDNDAVVQGRLCLPNRAGSPNGPVRVDGSHDRHLHHPTGIPRNCREHTRIGRPPGGTLS